MYKLRSLPLAAHLAIAAIVGTTFGAAAGLWSVRHGSRVAPVVQTPVSALAAPLSHCSTLASTRPSPHLALLHIVVQAPVSALAR